jgi:single-stranded-DNA-specific exonuclease
LPSPEPNFASLLDLVALGTVADVVKLDRNNRILVSQGLKRMRAGQMQAGIAALFKAAGRDPKKATAFDLGFILGPRLNAAGRLADMRLGVECLLTDDASRALPSPRNSTPSTANAAKSSPACRSRRALLESLDADEAAPGIALFDESWHEGVVGILASRIKDKLHRPVFAFAPAKAASSRAPAARFPACTCATRSTSSPSGPRPAALRRPRHGGGPTVNAENFEKFREPLPQSPANCSTRPT